MQKYVSNDCILGGKRLEAQILGVEATRHLLRNPILFQIWAPIKEYIAIIWRLQHLFPELHPSVESKQP